MDRRFEVRKQEILLGAQIPTQEFANWEDELLAFAQPFLDSFYRKEQKDHVVEILKGLLSNLKRKNVESIAYLNDKDRRNLQHFVGESKWDHRPIFEELTRQVAKKFGEENGVISIDPSGFKKYGNESVGTKRQWLGRLGKIDNGQVGIYLGYASNKGHAICDERLYLPLDWAKDFRRRKKCGIPKEIRFCTRHKLALEMLAEKGGNLPHKWITGDVEIGRNSMFRKELRNRHEQYVLGIPSNTSIREMEHGSKEKDHPENKKIPPFVQVQKWEKEQHEKTWSKIKIVDGEKGPLETEILKTKVQAREESLRIGDEEVLIITRIRENGVYKKNYYLSNASFQTPLEEFGKTINKGHHIEDCFRRAKSEAGLADYEVRTWQGWHHHQALSLVAVFFLTCLAMGKKKLSQQ